ncbi:MAG: copper transporter, partial [Coriobacteriaceae bacterium]|nr:copper transporter [Coriobacteriaceae bacterium]
MYNLRYHLVTICSIFLALAIGLLLGAAISGSNLVRDTSQGLVDSLLEQFNEITKENSDLSKRLAVEQPLTQQLLGTWQDGRLANRTVVVLTGATTADAELSRQASQAIARSGGVPVIITVKTAEFGLTDGPITESLQQLVPAVDGEPYTTTIGRVLVDEWTFDDLISIASLDQDVKSTDGSTNGTENGSSSKTTSTDGTKAITDEQAEKTEGSDSVITTTRLVSQYPLTTKLVDLG